MSHPHFPLAAVPQTLDADPVTGTPTWMLEHPRLSLSVMQQIDRVVHALFQSSPLMGQSVAMLLPSEARRIPRRGESHSEAFDRPPRPRELCAIELELSRTLHVDARRTDWRDLAADELLTFAQELTELAHLIRTAEAPRFAPGPISQDVGVAERLEAPAAAG